MSPPPFRPQRLHDLLAPWVVQQPDRLALRDDHVRYSYAELEQAADATAEQLRSAGVRAGDRVVIVGENCAATPLIALATTATGSQSLGVFPLIVMFLLALVLLVWVKAKGEAEQ